MAEANSRAVPTSGLEAYRILLRCEATKGKLETECRAIVSRLERHYSQRLTNRGWHLSVDRAQAGSADAKAEGDRTVFAFCDQYEDASIALEIDDGDIAVFSEVVLGARGADAIKARGAPVSKLAIELLAIFSIDLADFLDLKEPGRMKAEFFRKHAFRQSHTRPAYQAFDVTLLAGNGELTLRLLVAHRALLSRPHPASSGPGRTQNTSRRAAAPYANMGISAKLQIDGYFLQDIVGLKPGQIIAINDARARYLLSSGSQDLWSFALGERNGQLAIQLETRCARTA